MKNQKFVVVGHFKDYQGVVNSQPLAVTDNRDMAEYFLQGKKEQFQPSAITASAEFVIFQVFEI